MTNAAGTEPGPVQGRKSIATPAEGIFAKLRPGTKLYVRPAIPRSAEGQEYQVRHIEADRAVIQKLLGGQVLSISSSVVARLHNSEDHTPSTVVLSGRLQWITATRRWMFLPEEPAADSLFGLDKLASPDDPHVVGFVDRLRQAGYSPWWVPEEVMHEFLAQGGEVIYDEDGRYLRTQDERSSWVLLAKQGGPGGGPAL
ncbi:MAG TPA: hypothetical protein VI455_08735 [Terriglobia bacterium]